MSIEFENSFDNLIKSVINSPEDDTWFFPALKKLIHENGQDVVLTYVKNNPLSLYLISLLIKTGLKKVNASILLKALNNTDEDEVYDAAISLAIYRYDIGFETLYKFANRTHELSKQINSKTVILPDLKYINHPKSKELKVYINTKYTDN